MQFYFERAIEWDKDIKPRKIEISSLEELLELASKENNPIYNRKGNGGDVKKTIMTQELHDKMKDAFNKTLDLLYKEMEKYNDLELFDDPFADAEQDALYVLTEELKKNGDYSEEREWELFREYYDWVEE